MLKSPRNCISSAAEAAFSIWRENSFIHCTLELGGLYLQINSGIIICSYKNMHKPKKRFTFGYKKLIKEKNI